MWLAGSLADQLWLQLDQRLPAWDQADYLNSAVDHGRALGLLPGGAWPGWQGLLDLSPKVPPLASLVNGSVIALSGDSPDQASAALALWQGLLLVSVACWGRQLVSPGFGLLAAALTTTTPALLSLRLDFTLDLPLAATSVLALWLLGRWASPDPRGGRWHQAAVAALALAAAVLVKQSALLVLLPPALWVALRGLGRARRRWQALAALALVLTLVLPWLQHNWITTIGGTNRAVLESAAQEGDPPAFSLASLLWYPRLWPQQLGLANSVPALAGTLLALHAAWPWRRDCPQPQPADGTDRTQGGWGWRWLIGCGLSGWLFTTLSPNKDPRYITPVLPLLVLLLSWGWWQLGQALLRQGWRRASWAALAAGLAASAGSAVTAQAGEIRWQPRSPLPDVMDTMRQQVGDQPRTLVMLPNAAELNEHTATVFGRARGGQIVARQLGRQPRERELVLDQAEWVLLTTGEAGMRREASRKLASAIRQDSRFRLVGRWPWSDGEPVELWTRRQPVPATTRFDRRFIELASGLERGPAGLAPVFEAIGPQHQLDGHWHYQGRVIDWAEQRLRSDPGDRDALWALALLAVLRNRPFQADQWFSRLQTLEPANPWPPAYRSVVLLAGWNPWRAHAVATAATRGHQEPVLNALADVSGALLADPFSLQRALRSVPQATRRVTDQLNKDK
ncbi:glycosyltransferase family 39 protein [Synechococcus sp. Cruz-9H2]|nr:glycosyltransferase family 39 protein [Synechococcus sp. Cruz-9H2]MCP9845027.1 glycosyltransferase family 39 protein [Synechococcus sp. Edmonson 11F2]MCP9857183.1 glycosyltransferase family 39 protein [Synechococcus sp. Cruz-9C9]MCP9864433.1 glycosyltransferase family 39 protein [Synechococcus sp. Cruz-7E5]MCP9871737.1 glycosyltransferase family 39 protein [Synechococcus sp. Cruz-7B9]